jgi:hypothetical protein
MVMYVLESLVGIIIKGELGGILKKPFETVIHIAA